MNIRLVRLGKTHPLEALLIVGAIVAVVAYYTLISFVGLEPGIPRFFIPIFGLAFIIAILGILNAKEPPFENVSRKQRKWLKVELVFASVLTAGVILFSSSS